MTLRAHLVEQLRQAGHHAAADHVRYSSLPGQAVATLPEIAAYYANGRNHHAAEIINAAIDSSCACGCPKQTADMDTTDGLGADRPTR